MLRQLPIAQRASLARPYCAQTQSYVPRVARQHQLSSRICLQSTSQRGLIRSLASQQPVQPVDPAEAADANEEVAGSAEGYEYDEVDVEQGDEEQFQKQEEEEMVDIEVTEYTEIEEQAQPRVQVIAQQTQTFFTRSTVGQGISVVAGAVLLFTLGLAVKRVVEKSNTPRAQRLKQVSRNKLLVDELNKVLPGARDKLTPNLFKGLCKRVGCTEVEGYRKYLWYLLRERRFDQEAVNDMIALKAAGGLTDENVAEALRERAQRIYDKYGTLMLNTDGMTAGGVERKATVLNLSSKLLYLAESEMLVKQDSEAAKKMDLRKIFGATDEDMQRIRIVSLHDQDVDLERLFAAVGADEFSYTDEDEDDTKTATERKRPPQPPPAAPEGGGAPKAQ